MFKKLFPPPKVVFGKPGRVRQHRVSGHPSFRMTVERLERAPLVDPVKLGQPVYVFFTAALNPKTGAHWCPYCARAESEVMQALQRVVRYKCDFVHCEVGDQAQWRDRKNPFRLDRDTRLLALPTLLKWRSQKRLEALWASKPDMLDIFFDLNEE